MWQADEWKDYEVLDTSRGEKLERWGKYVLVRPDPQVIWNTPKNDPLWRKYDARYCRSSTGGGAWSEHRLPEHWQVRYKELTFNVKPMVAWAKENAKSSGLEDRPIRWIVDDCAKFVEREIRRGRRYDAIIMDPPSYGRGPSGEIWKLEENLFPFVELCTGVLSDEPLFVIINSYTTGLAPSVLGYILDTLITKKHGGAAQCGELGLPVRDSGLVLPCGSTGRWVR